MLIHRKRPELPYDGEEEPLREGENMTPEQRRSYLWGVLHAGLLIGCVYLVIFAAVIALLCVLL